MITVTIGDVLEVGGPRQNHVVLLHDAAQGRLLPIWIGSMEGRAIARSLRPMATARPLTIDFTAGVLEAAGATLDSVSITTLKDDTYYAIALVRSADTVREVDARPSDALALAAHVGCPIYVAEEVLLAAAISGPEAASYLTHLGAGLDVIAEQEDVPAATFGTF